MSTSQVDLGCPRCGRPGEWQEQKELVPTRGYTTSRRLWCPQCGHATRWGGRNPDVYVEWLEGRPATRGAGVVPRLETLQVELRALDALGGVTFAVASWDKRFFRSLRDHVAERPELAMTERQRWWLFRLVVRYRRQIRDVVIVEAARVLIGDVDVPESQKRLPAERLPAAVEMAKKATKPVQMRLDF